MECVVSMVPSDLCVEWRGVLIRPRGREDVSSMVLFMAIAVKKGAVTRREVEVYVENTVPSRFDNGMATRVV